MKHARIDRRLLMTKNLILMLVMLVVIGMAVYSWFVVNRTVSADNMTVKASTIGDVKICLADDYGNAKKAGNLYDFRDSVEISSNKLIKDATSDGQTFLVPAFSVTQNNNEGKIVNLNAAPKVAIPYRDVKAQIEANPDSEYDYHYLTYEFYVRSDLPNLKVREGSYVASGLEITNSNALSIMANAGNNDANRPAKSYGAFSSDALVGAIRLSLVGTPWNSNNIGDNFDDDDYDDYKALSDSQPCQFLWLPRPDVKLDTSPEIGSWTLSTGVTPSNDSANYKHTFYKKSGNNAVIPIELSEGDNTVDSNNYTLSVSSLNRMSSGLSTNVPTLDTPKSITDFDYPQNQPSKITLTDGTGSYYVFRYTLNIWIEGSDLEARRAMDTGQFKVNLVFSN